MVNSEYPKDDQVTIESLGHNEYHYSISSVTAMEILKSDTEAQGYFFLNPS